MKLQKNYCARAVSVLLSCSVKGICLGMFLGFLFGGPTWVSLSFFCRLSLALIRCFVRPFPSDFVCCSSPEIDFSLGVRCLCMLWSTPFITVVRQKRWSVFDEKNVDPHKSAFWSEEIEITLRNEPVPVVNSFTIQDVSTEVIFGLFMSRLLINANAKTRL